MSKIMTLNNPHSLTDVATQRTNHLALMALFAGAIAISFAPIFVRLSQVGPSATGFWRLALALPALWLWFNFEGRRATAPRQPVSLTDYSRLALAGLFLAGDLAVWHSSIKFTSVTNATLLANFSPVFVAFGAWVLFRERFSLLFYLGIATAIVGAVILIGSGFNLGGQHLVGDGLGLLAAVFYAGYMLTVKQLRRDFSTATIMAWGGLATCLALLPVTVLAGEKLLAVTLGGWAVLAGLALSAQLGGQGLITFALAHLPAPFSSVSLLLQPVVAPLLAWGILSEPLGLWQVVGGAIVLAGIFLARWSSRSP
jgi:drug/metabolite transporter (DMT)-like permease